MTRDELGRAVASREDLASVQYIQIADIPQPWQDQFLCYLQAGLPAVSPSQERCVYLLWKDWLWCSERNFPSLSPKDLTEEPVDPEDLDDARSRGLEWGIELAADCYADGRLEENLRKEIAIKYPPSEPQLRHAHVRGAMLGLASVEPIQPAIRNGLLKMLCETLPL